MNKAAVGRRHRPFTPDEDRRMIEMRLSSPGYAGAKKIGAALGRRPETILNRLQRIARHNPALSAKLAEVASRPRRERKVAPVIAMLHERRKALGLSRPALAKIAGYSKSSFEVWELGRRFPERQVLLDWAQALGVEIVAQETGE